MVIGQDNGVFRLQGWLVRVHPHRSRVALDNNSSQRDHVAHNTDCCSIRRSSEFLGQLGSGLNVGSNQRLVNSSISQALIGTMLTFAAR